MRDAFPLVVSVAAVSALAVAVTSAGAITPIAGVAGLHAVTSNAGPPDTNPTIPPSSAPTTTAATDADGGGVVEVRPGVGDPLLVDASIASDVQRLFDDAAGDGVLLGGSGLRSHQRQHELRRINGCPDGWTHTDDEDPSGWAPSSSCVTPTARPGFSNHESGLAIDFTYSGRVIGSRSGLAWEWLAANAPEYGLCNLPSEAWHWSTNCR